AVLKYHVVPGKVMAKDVVKVDSAKTAQGSSVTVTVEGKTVKVDNATVVKTDIEASNGVIHVIDTVIIPE
ncbi:MAG: fasciclin domain-containing protein, partial [Planctomycetota bacterium]|nr:fasciclin domain-containing protein [Planctomycetota bacterium]